MQNCRLTDRQTDRKHNIFTTYWQRRNKKGWNKIQMDSQEKDDYMNADVAVSTAVH